MQVFETVAQVGTDGVLRVEHLPFAAGASVKVRVEEQAAKAAEPPTKSADDAAFEAKLDAMNLDPETRKMIGIIPRDAADTIRAEAAERQTAAPEFSPEQLDELRAKFPKLRHMIGNIPTDWDVRAMYAEWILRRGE